MGNAWQSGKLLQSMDHTGLAGRSESSRERLDCRPDGQNKVRIFSDFLGWRLAFPVSLAAALFLATAESGAAELYVAPNGTGDGGRAAPLGRVQAALDKALPGDVVWVLPGTYTESLRTVRDGRPDAPIRLKATGPKGSAVVTASGRVLLVDHADLVVEGLVLDGQYGPADTVAVRDAADRLVLRDLEVRRSSRELIDMAGPRDVLIERCLLHHALDAAGGRTDAHAVAAGTVRNLTIRDSEIHTFSGDGLQVDPGRAAPGWSDVTIERSSIWLAPLPAAENGFPAGTVPGENAVDTKASPSLPRARLVLRDVVARGFRNGLIGNMAAFNLKEHVAVVVDRVTVSDSEIAFRLRGPAGGDRGGAEVTIMNTVIYDTDVAFRYEDDIRNLRILNSTVGANVATAFVQAGPSSRNLDVRNVLFLGRKPREAAGASNLGVPASAFANVRGHDYQLVPGAAAVDAGVSIQEVVGDRRGRRRPEGRGFDVGAHELEASSSGR